MNKINERLQYSESSYEDFDQDDYNEEIYKWLSIGVLMIWILCMFVL
ncbi:MAG: hypothetical protein JNK43_05510 [Ignavibacteria bacterium]|nr:hypothetical protein [Ignavibacteria bacterium]